MCLELLQAWRCLQIAWNHRLSVENRLYMQPRDTTPIRWQMHIDGTTDHRIVPCSNYAYKQPKTSLIDNTTCEPIK